MDQSVLETLGFLSLILDPGGERSKPCTTKWVGSMNLLGMDLGLLFWGGRECSSVCYEIKVGKSEKQLQTISAEKVHKEPHLGLIKLARKNLRFLSNNIIIHLL